MVMEAPDTPSAAGVLTHDLGQNTYPPGLRVSAGRPALKLLRAARQVAWRRMVSGTDHETVLNSRLADLLRDAGLDAKAENRQPGSTKQIDVDVNPGSYRVALKAEIDNPKGAWQDAEKRRGEAEAGLVVADRAIAVNYPAGLQASNFTAGTSIELAVLPSKRMRG